VVPEFVVPEFVVPEFVVPEVEPVPVVGPVLFGGGAGQGLEAPAVPEVEPDAPAVSPVDGEGEPAFDSELIVLPVVLPVLLPAVPDVVAQGPLCGFTDG
jgi:hypothetical protein